MKLDFGRSVNVPQPGQTGRPTPPNVRGIDPWMSIVTLLDTSNNDFMMAKPPQVMTVVFNPVTIQRTNFAANITDVKARVEYGAGGQTTVVDIDAINGMTFSIIGNFVRVSGIFTPVVIGAANGTAIVPANFPSLIAMGASVAYGNRGSGGGVSPSWSDYSQINPASSVNFIIPPFATSYTVVGQDQVTLASPANLIMTLFSSVGGQQISTIAQAGNVNNTYPLPGGCQVLNISNPGANNVTVSVRFGLIL